MQSLRSCMNTRPRAITLVLCIVIAAVLYTTYAIRSGNSLPLVSEEHGNAQQQSSIDLQWYAPSESWITDLDKVINGKGMYGFEFGNVKSPTDGSYAYCNMPHVHASTYVRPSVEDFELIYVESVHRHHKRTPYQHNGFPVEAESWNCPEDEEHSFGHVGYSTHASASTFRTIQQSPSNPFTRQGLHGSCKFPQITRNGLEDSWWHGSDFAGVYGELLRFIPERYDKHTSIRVTNNVITTAVASMALSGMFLKQGQSIPLRVESEEVDSLEPQYFCDAAQHLTDTSILGSNPTWQGHLTTAKDIFVQLDAISGVSEYDRGFHMSFDHYFDNLSTRQCHERALPCSSSDKDKCISQELADTVYRLGQWEYSWMYRGSAHSFAASIGSYGVWFAELAQNIRDAIAGNGDVKLRYNVAHDGSIARILSILQIETMVWPGMGAEVIFELYRRKEVQGKHVLRVLWGGQVLRSSNPSLALMDMIDLDVFLGYVHGLVGTRASNVVDFCTSSPG